MKALLNDLVILAKLLALLLVAVLIIPLVLAMSWAVFGGFWYFWFFYNRARSDSKGEWWNLPVTIVTCLVYWLICKKYGMLGVVIPAIMHAMQGV